MPNDIHDYILCNVIQFEPLLILLFIKEYFKMVQQLFTYLVVLTLVHSMDPKIIETHVVPQKNCDNIESFKSVKVECTLEAMMLITNLEIGGSVVPFLIDTGTHLTWVLTNETTYSWVKFNHLSLHKSTNSVRTFTCYSNPYYV